MNFYNQFVDSWNSRFPGDVKPPVLDCLKADQFNSVVDQKHALEEHSTKVSDIIEDLKLKMDYEAFTHDYLQKCIQKLGAISQVFNEIDHTDSKSSSPSYTNGRHPCSSNSPGDTSNGTMFSQPTAPCFPSSTPNFPLLPQCIASRLINSASPLLAAVATSTAPFLFPSTLSSFPCPESIKSDPDQVPQSARLTNSNGHTLLPDPHSTGFAVAPSPYTNPFSSGTHYTSTLNCRHSSYDMTNPITTDCSGRLTEDLSVPTSDAQAAAAAVAAAFGLNFPSVHGTGTLTNMGFGKQNDQVGTNLLQISPLGAINGVDSKDVDSSVERPFQCVTCSRSFAVKAGLVQHMRTHTDERPYPCIHCGRAFKQKIQLTTHMRVHSGERPYGCRLCGKLFRQQSHVVQHLRTHTGEKPHKCYQCGKAFRQKYSLISHQRRMCRNRSASNPIAAGMTMWISPGVGGNTGNLVKEFSPTKCTLPVTSPTASMSTPISVMTSLHSPSSPCPTSPVSNLPTPLPQPRFQSPISMNGEPHCENQNLSTRSRRHSLGKPRFTNPEVHNSLTRHNSLLSTDDSSICSTRTSRPTNLPNPTPLGLI